MDIANLQAFVSVASTGSFSAASERLHLTQPAVSKRIANLESELGVNLFDRIGRRIQLTEAGHTLLPRAQRILTEIADSRRALLNLSREVAGTLTIATSHHIGLHRLPPLLREFANRYPDVQLDMRFTDSELGCTAVARGEAELAIVTLPITYTHTHKAITAALMQAPLDYIPVWDDPLVIVVNRDHPLAGEASIDAIKLSAYQAILPGEITFTRSIVTQYFRTRNIPLRTAFSTNYLETIKMMVAVGLGWSVLPRTMVDGDLSELPVADFGLHRILGIVQHNSRTLSNAARAMQALVAQQSDSRYQTDIGIINSGKIHT